MRPGAKPVALPMAEGDRHLILRVAMYLLMDDSGSMYGSWGDPSGVRYAAALSLFRLMERLGGGRAGVVHWGSTAPEEMVTPLVDVKKGKRQLRNALQIPPTLGGNNLPLALGRAADLLARPPADARPAVCVLTDGIEEVGAAAQAQIDRLPPGAVHVLLIDHGKGCDDRLEAAWRQLSLGSFTRLNVNDTHRMAWQLADIATKAVGLTMPPYQPPKESR